MTMERALVVVALIAAWAGDKYGRPPTRTYLREGATTEICAPYVPKGEVKTHWSCVPTSTVIAKILKEPPDCPH